MPLALTVVSYSVIYSGFRLSTIKVQNVIKITE
jgi:hypothetical protein